MNWTCLSIAIVGVCRRYVCSVPWRLFKVHGHSETVWHCNKQLCDLRFCTKFILVWGSTADQHLDPQLLSCLLLITSMPCNRFVGQWCTVSAWGIRQVRHGVNARSALASAVLSHLLAHFRWSIVQHSLHANMCVFCFGCRWPDSALPTARKHVLSWSRSV